MRPAPAARGGFSMLETVIALALLSFVAALVATRASVMLDQIAAHTAFQQFQTGLLSLRGRAFAAGADLEASPASLRLPQGWSFRAEAPLTAGEDGRCTGGAVELVRDGRVRVRLTPGGGPCRYLRAA